MTHAAISTENLGKRFGPFWAAQGITFEVRPGEVVGFIGRNGAGKTTVMRMITSLLRPTTGTIRIQGLESHGSAAHRIGFMPQSARFTESATVGELVRFFSRLRKSPAEKPLALVGELGLDLTRRVRVLSPGQQKKLQLVLAFVGEPEILVLDEPTAGLDPMGIAQLRDVVRDLQAQGRAILISTHILSELDQICSKVAIIDSGKLLYQGLVPRMYEIETDGFCDHARQRLIARWGSAMRLHGTSVRLEIDRTVLPSALRELLELGLNVYTVREGSLERFFSEVTGASGTAER